MKALIKIETKRMWRDKRTFIMSIGFPIFFYFIFTKINDVPKGYEQQFYTEYLMSMTVFSLTNFALFMFPFDIIKDKKNGWRKRLMHVDLTTTNIYSVKMLKMIFLFSVAITGVFLVGSMVNKVKLTAVQWVVSGIVLLLGGLVFLSIGLIISYFEEEKTAAAFSNILYLGMAAIGGLWMPTELFPEWAQPISKAMPTYQFRELAVGYIRDGSIPLKAVGSLLCYGLLFIGISYAIDKYQRVDILS